MTDSMVPMANLASEWGVNSNTVSRRLRHLGIKPERQGNLRFITLEEKALADDLQRHILSGQTIDSFPVPGADGSITAIERKKSSQVTGPVIGSADFIAALTQINAPARPSRAEQLAKAADGGWVLTTEELKEIGVKGLEGFKNGDLAVGYRFNRTKQRGIVLWTLTRALIAKPETSTPALTAAQPTATGMGFHSDHGAAARAIIDVPAIEWTGSSLFNQIRIG